MTSASSVAQAVTELRSTFAGEYPPVYRRRLRGSEESLQWSGGQTTGIDRPMPRQPCSPIKAFGTPGLDTLGSIS